MPKLIYITNTSLDGYVEDATGAFDWVNPDRVHAFITGLVRPVGIHLYGRRLYETMAYWDATVESYSPEYRDFARVWQKAEKIVFSRTLTVATAHNTRVLRDFDPEAIRKLKRESEHDVIIFLNPVVVGGGKPAFQAGLRRKLELVDARSFDTGAIHLHYRLVTARS